jgi:bifunctional DNase/RNase
VAGSSAIPSGIRDHVQASLATSRTLPFGLAVLVLALCATGVALAVPRDLIELEVLGVVPLESDSGSILVLRQRGARTLLPIFIGRAEGDDIDGRIKRRPATLGRGADLAHKSIEALGGKVTRVVIDGADGRQFRARVAVDQGQNHHDLEARPSDSVALALASRAPIYATRHVMSEAGLTEQDLARERSGARHPSAAEPDRSFRRVESF